MFKRLVDSNFKLVKMAKVPSLISLGVEAIRRLLVRGDDVSPAIYELPLDLFDILVAKLPPLALEKLLSEMPLKNWNYYGSTDDCLKNGRKRGRNGNFNAVWKALFKLRWPELVDSIQPEEWQQMYWQSHMQNCLDEAAELALLPSFDGCIGEIEISDDILKFIGCGEDMNRSNYLKLSYHCQQFGHYVRCLRLQNVLCVAETCQLLMKSRLRSLVLRLIRSEEHVGGLCKLLIQSRETLISLELINCKLSSTFLDAICDSLEINNMRMHEIQNFSINRSSFLDIDPVTSLGLVSFLSSGRSLCLLKFCGNHLGRNFARMLFSTLIDSSSCLSVLDLSDNNIEGWLSNFNGRSSSGVPSSLGIGKPLQSLRTLNVRGNNLRKEDVEGLRYALFYMPSLEILDISDNPIGDDGIRCLVPYFNEDSKRCSPLTELYLENCELSFNGVSQLLYALSTLERPLSSLSLADNGLGSQVAGALGKFMGTSIKALDIGGIGLGSAGFQELQKEMVELKLAKLNISKNRGGFETAKFLSKLLSMAPELIAVNAAYNLMPLESLTIICSALKAAKGQLECLDLTGNTWEYDPSHASMLTEFQHNGRPVLILPLSIARDVPYDDDP